MLWKLMKNNIPCEMIKDVLPSYVDKLTSDVTNNLVEEHINECKDCKNVLESMQDSSIENIGEDDNNIKEIIEAPVGESSHQIKLTDKQRLIVIPQAYRSLQIKGNTGTPVENNDKGSSFTQSQIFARDNSSSSAPSNKKTVGNVDISVYEMGLNEDPTVWHVNSNNNRF